MKLSKLALAPLALAGLVASLHATEITIYDVGDGLPFVSQDSSGSFQDLLVVHPPGSAPEHIVITGYVEKNLGTSHLTIGLIEPETGFLSDFLFVGWTQRASGGITDFVMLFFSYPDEVQKAGTSMVMALETSNGKGNGFHPSDGLPAGFNVFIMSGD